LNRDSFVLGVRLDLVQERDAVVGAFLVGHAAPVARERDDVRHLIGGALVDRRTQRRLQLGVVFRPIERVGDGAAGAERIHRRHEAILPQHRPLRRADQVEALDAEASGLAAALLERHPAREHATGDALFDTAFPRERRLRHGCRCKNDGSNQPEQEISAVHVMLLHHRGHEEISH
jgi:hypothetical protein